MTITDFPHIGKVQFVKSAKAKYIRISLKPCGGIRVTVPERASMLQAMAFVEQKTAWILQAKLRMRIHENRRIVFTPDTIFSTHTRQLRLIPWESGNFRSQLSKNDLKIFFPQDVDIQSEQSQEIIRNYIISTDRKSVV